MNDPELHIALSSLYQDHAACLDGEDFERWPQFFTEGAVYRAQGRENFERQLPLAAILCEGHAMMADRVAIIRKGMIFAPRYIRHHVGTPRIIEQNEQELRCEASFMVFHTLPHRPTELLSVGRYLDRIVRLEHGRLLFSERLAVYDSLLIPNSLVYPL